MAIDLTKLEKKFIDLFANVTQEEFEQWLLTKNKPMAQQTPDPKLIESMALRYRHDFGFLDEPQKEAIRTTMKQLWEEVVGLGFYKPTTQQTAVEWLVNELESEAITDYSFAQAHKLITLDVYTFNKLIEQAKQMFEEQVKDGFLECWKSNVPVGVECKLDAQQYYNETYKNNI